LGRLKELKRRKIAKLVWSAKNKKKPRSGTPRRARSRGKIFALDPFNMDQKRRKLYERPQGPARGRDFREAQGNPFTRSGNVKKNFRNLEYDEKREAKMDEKRTRKIKKILDLTPKKRKPKNKPEKKDTALSKLEKRPGESFFRFKNRVREAMLEDRLKILKPKSTRKKEYYKKKRTKKFEKIFAREAEEQRDLEDEPQVEVIEFGETVRGPPTLPRSVKRKFRQSDMLPKDKKKQRFKKLTFSKKIEERAEAINREKIMANYKRAKAEKLAQRKKLQEGESRKAGTTKKA